MQEREILLLYGTFLYEILNLNEPKEIFGQVEHKMEIWLNA
jgi:hypothetical protein